MAETQYETFHKLLDQHLATINESRRQKYLITQEMYEKIVSTVQVKSGEKSQYGATFKFWCKTNFKIEEIGQRKILYCIKTSRPVATKEDLFDVLANCHKRVQHSGRDKTFEEVKRNYSWIPRRAVSFYLQTCRECHSKKASKTPQASKTIISLGYLSRLQIDLIDMTSIPDGEYIWILYAKDHFTKFSWAYALTSNRTDEVASKLVEQFCFFGTPVVLQSDHGQEFTASVIKDLAEMCPGLVVMNDCPCHPESQGCVDCGDGDFQIELGKWMEQHQEGWTKGLKFVVHGINTAIAGATGKTPFELVFGQAPRHNFHLLETLQSQGLVREEDDDSCLFSSDDQATGCSVVKSEPMSSFDLEVWTCAHTPLTVPELPTVKTEMIVPTSSFDLEVAAAHTPSTVPELPTLKTEMIASSVPETTADGYDEEMPPAKLRKIGTPKYLSTAS
ncbi:KRAB-A domain-containing protein 2-like isoform X2 [Lingula anatina]|uniref:KRAB-A domain-containing protein 2-like isoform X2 n=1 Tax=Lingula anatina TaxID=7574 RepID=A0A1S3IFH8_LINAN|nr:KRAB-A domain-containing protein 2-like isoform X2 [Lingula anatina]|eukprot:XP_013396219.1 KRAB-A domain-containing protein 2-like isoform X2 [Lingula anatina]